MHLAVVRYSHRLCNVVAFQTFLTQHGLPIPSDDGGQQAGDGSSEHSGDASGRHHHARRRSSFLLADALAKAKELEAENQRLRDELQEAEAFLHEQRRKVCRVGAESAHDGEVAVGT